MAAHWEDMLQRWVNGGLLDADTARKIRDWEATQAHGRAPSRMSALAFSFGGLLLMAGVFLFVSAHWDSMSPTARYGLVLGLVALFHTTAATSTVKLPALATTLHAVGTAALGAGIFLAGQIFNMAEHWPGALMLWSMGAVCALYLLRDWPHVLWVAVLVPAWLVGEWSEISYNARDTWSNAPPLVGLVLLTFTYLAADSTQHDSSWRRTLSRLGAIGLIPACVALRLAHQGLHAGDPHANVSGVYLYPSWILAVGLPLLTAFLLRGKQAFFLLLALPWCILIVGVDWDSGDASVALYALYALGAVAVAAWGIRERIALNVNLGVLGFALTVLTFYFSDVFDKLDRSIGLVGMGILFLGGGWLLERLRRQLVSNISGSLA